MGQTGVRASFPLMDDFLGLSQPLTMCEPRYAPIHVPMTHPSPRHRADALVGWRPMVPSVSYLIVGCTGKAEMASWGPASFA